MKWLFFPLIYAESNDLVKIVVCNLVSGIHMTFYIMTKGYSVWNMTKLTRSELNECDIFSNGNNLGKITTFLIGLGYAFGETFLYKSSHYH